MKILTISTWFPIPPDNGSRARTCHLLRALGKRHTVDLLAISQSHRDMEHLDEVREFCRRVATFPPRRFSPESNDGWQRFFSKMPRHVRARHSPDMQALAERWAGEEGYDAIVAITLGAAPYVSALSAPFKVLDQHNVESQIIKREWQSEENLLRRIRYAPTWVKAEHFEREMADMFDTISVVSEPERHLMARLIPGKRIEVVPNGVDPALFDYPKPERSQGTMVFSGAVTYHANYDAAKWLSSEVLPLVQESLPSARAYVTGGTGSVDVESMSRLGIMFTGYVDDIRPVVAGASLVIVPLRQGGGTRLKILEAMALGTPVVSTSIGAQGLDLIHGEHILLGETAGELAAHALALMRDSALARRLADSAREFVSAKYQWPSIAERFASIFG
jgi:glycosyltransferase involved in cell wall biosynthesis